MQHPNEGGEMQASRWLLMVMRLGALIQVVVGIGFWTGHWQSLIDLHRGVGMLYVIALWAIAAIALAQRRSVGLAVFAIVWGVIVAGLGFSQARIMPGDYHWVVRVLHLVISLAAMPIAERLAAGARVRAAVTA